MRALRSATFQLTHNNMCMRLYEIKKASLLVLLKFKAKAGGGGISLRPYSQQGPMRTNLSFCLGLIDNGQYKSTNRLLVLVPHDGIMKILENLCMSLPKALKMRAIKDTEGPPKQTCLGLAWPCKKQGD